MKNKGLLGTLGFAVGACAGIAVVGAIKQKMDTKRQREAAIEAQLTSIFEQKFAELEAEENAVEEEKCL